MASPIVAGRCRIYHWWSDSSIRIPVRRPLHQVECRFSFACGDARRSRTATSSTRV